MHYASSLSAYLLYLPFRLPRSEEQAAWRAVRMRAELQAEPRCLPHGAMVDGKHSSCLSHPASSAQVFVANDSFDLCCAHPLRLLAPCAYIRNEARHMRALELAKAASSAMAARARMKSQLPVLQHTLALVSIYTLFPSPPRRKK